MARPSLIAPALGRGEPAGDWVNVDDIRLTSWLYRTFGYDRLQHAEVEAWRPFRPLSPFRRLRLEATEH